MTSLLMFVVAAAVPDQSFLEEALFAGGARDQQELERLVKLYHQRIDPMVEVVKDLPKQIAAQLLLKHLHVTYGGTTAVLGEYKRNAWSINEALISGKYNCLSATMFFILAGRQAGLDVTGEYYPGHARAVFYDQGREWQVEATSTYGFGADEWFLGTRADENGQLAIVVEMPRGRGADIMLDAAWAWAGERRDQQWASHVVVTPPPLISVSQVSRH